MRLRGIEDLFEASCVTNYWPDSDERWAACEHFDLLLVESLQNGENCHQLTSVVSVHSIESPKWKATPARREISHPRDDS